MFVVDNDYNDVHNGGNDTFPVQRLGAFMVDAPGHMGST
jgi:hypothetical protein